MGASLWAILSQRRSVRISQLSCLKFDVMKWRRRNASNYHSPLRKQTLLKNAPQSWDTLNVNKHLSSFPDRFVLRRRHTMLQPQHTMSQPQHTMSQHLHTMLLILSTLHLCSLPTLHSLDNLFSRTDL